MIIDLTRAARMQLSFEEIVLSADRARDAAIHRYMDENDAQYRRFALDIEPQRGDWCAVWDRVAFAILTANAAVEDAVTAFRLTRAAGRIAPREWRVQGMTPEKANYVNALPRGRDVFALLRHRNETWDHYRLRLCADVRGLALTKASYTACILYPTTADVACLDTWIQRVFLYSTKFTSLSYPQYVTVEERVREFAKEHRVSTALAQWEIWDWARRITTSQRFFD